MLAKTNEEKDLEKKVSAVETALAKDKWEGSSGEPKVDVNLRADMPTKKKLKSISFEPFHSSRLVCPSTTAISAGLPEF